MEFDSKGDSVFLASVECFHGRIMDMSGLMHVHPRRWIGNPVLNCGRRLPVCQLIPDDGGEDHFFKQCWKNVDMPDQDQIVDRAGVGDDQLHLSKSKTFQILHIAVDILNGDVGPDLTSPQKVVEFVTGLKAQQTAQLSH